MDLGGHLGQDTITVRPTTDTSRPMGLPRKVLKVNCGAELLNLPPRP